MTPVPLTPMDLVLASLLLVASAGLSMAYRLDLERSLAVSAIRMVLQLGVVGLALKFIFEQTSPVWMVMFAVVMVTAAGFEAINRGAHGIARVRLFGFSTTILLIVGVVATMYAVAGIVGPAPWYQPRYVLPILGMVLGNALTGVSLVLSTLIDTIQRDRRAIESRLALGATRGEALAGPMRQALKTGMTPIVNAMAVSGLVSLPGMMTGQIIAGADPIEAAKYQIMIMFVLAGAVGLAALAAGRGGIYLMTDARHRLKIDLIQSD